MHDNSMKKYVFFTLFVVASVLAIAMLWPFLTVLIFSLALSAVFYPSFRWLNRRIARGRSWLAALLTVLFFIIILCVPLFFIGSVIFSQSQNLASWMTENGGVHHITSSLNQFLARFVPSGVDVSDNVTNLIGSVSASIGTVFSTTLSGIFSLLLVILCMFYLLKDGKQWKDMLVSISPLSDDASHAIIIKMTSAVNGIIRGYLLVGIIQGLLVSTGMYIFGVPHAALWGTLAGIASLIPSIGTALVSVPTVIFLLAAGQTGAAIGYGIWAAVLVGSIDNILSPFIVGRSVAIHPLLVLFSVLGGIALMGPVGILIGPLVICFIYTLMSVYKTEVV